MSVKERRDRRAEAADPRPTRKRRGPLLLVILILVIAPAAWFTVRSARPASHTGTPPANLVLITLDTTRADHLSCYGGTATQTPHLDQIAAEGARCAYCTTCSPITLPSHSSILTGLYPYAHGARQNGTGRLAPANETLTEVLQSAGLQTRAVVASFVLNAQYGTSQGFDEYRDVVPDADTAALAAERRGDAVCDDALEMLAAVAGEPFFLWVHFYDPHHPYLSARHPDTHSPLAYADEVAFMDQQVGRLMAKLAALGLDASTLVVVVGDHGEGLGQHDELQHGNFVYDSTIHVPLLLRCPGVVPAGGTVTGHVRTIDIAPTILELMDQPALALAQGTSFVDLLTGAAADPPRFGYSEALNPHVEYGLSILRSWTDGEWKYIHAPRRELFHLAGDPGETRNLAASEPERLVEMEAALRQLIADAPVPPRASESSVTLGSAEIARLESLGYVAAGSVADDQVPEIERFEPTGGDPKDYVRLFHATVKELSVYQAQGEYAKAEALLRELIEMVPGASRLHVHLATTLGALGRVEEAKQAFATAVQLAPEDVSVRWRFGSYLRLHGEPERALEELAAVIRAIPDYQPAYYDAALAHRALGELSEAEELLRTAVKIEPKDARALRALAVVLEEQGNLPDALQYINLAIECDPEFKACLDDRQRILQKMGW